MPRRLVPSAHTKVSLSRYWQTALPRHPRPSFPSHPPLASSSSTPSPPSTPFWTCYVEYSTVSPDRKIFFRPRAIDEGKIRHVARESRYLLCNLCKSRGHSYVARILMARGKINRPVTRSFSEKPPLSTALRETASKYIRPPRFM